MSTTVRWLLTLRDLDLTLVGGHEAIDRDINCALTSELPSPQEWLAGGELLLTTGLRLPATRAERFDYLQGLQGIGVAGVGFGVGFGFDAVPRDLIDAADEFGIALVEVPFPVPFSAIARAVLDRIAEQRFDQFVRASHTQPRITRAIISGGMPAVVRELADAIDATVLLLDHEGALVSSRPADPDPDHLALVRGEITRDPNAASGVTITGDHTVTIQRISVGGSVFGYLAVLSEVPLGDLERVLLGHASSLLSLEHAKPIQVQRDQQSLHADALMMAMAGPPPAAARNIVLRAADREGRVRVATATFVSVAAAKQAAMAVGVELQSRWRPVFVHHVGQEIVVLVRGEDQRRFAESVLGVVGARGCRGGLGSVVPVDEIAESTRHARLAADVAAEGEVVDLLAQRSLLALEPVRKALSGARVSRLGPLADHDRDQGSDLVATLQAYLQANGQWEPAALAIGVHRHTLRHRIDRIERLLRVDLTDARTRAELLLILLSDRR
ncbi:PucR family transcriptional regulator [Williamsia sp.]|uniref:PucR family transcriptional regulator n=1 Tax=Williamsia sp. TaxID=1872085 RepID=UPI002F94740C